MGPFSMTLSSCIPLPYMTAGNSLFFPNQPVASPLLDRAKSIKTLSTFERRLPSLL